VGENQTRQSLQPEAIGVVMEVTKWLKPSISVSRIGGSASAAALQKRFTGLTIVSEVSIQAEDVGSSG
jgi:hypothetical protein